MNVYQLDIFTEHGVIKVHGDRELMARAYDEIKEAMDRPDGTGKRLVEVHGITDNADRGEVSAIVQVDTIRACTLTKLWGAAA